VLTLTIHLSSAFLRRDVSRAYRQVAAVVYSSEVDGCKRRRRGRHSVPLPPAALQRRQRPKVHVPPRDLVVIEPLQVV